MNILIVNEDLPIFPGRAGHEYLNTTRLGRQSDTVGLVSMVHTREQFEKTQNLLERGIQLFLWENPYLSATSSATPPVESRAPLLRQIGKKAYVFLRAGFTRPRDTLLEDYQFRNLAGPLLQALDNHSWQALVIIQSKCAHWIEYTPRLPASVLVLHDIRARVYERQTLATPSMFRRLILSLEAWRYRKFERTFCKRFGRVITVSSADETWVRNNYGLTNVVTVPIPIDHQYFRPLVGIAERANRIIFTGMMSHGPNIDAAIFYTQQVLPLVQAELPDAEFWIVGQEPISEVQALAAQPGVLVTGTVSDIRPYLAQAAVVVVPIRYGSGMRNKILEAWAMEKCVISTRVGAEGLDYRDGENIIIADDAPTLATRTIEALRDPVLRNRIRQDGRHIIHIHHEPDRVARQYHEAITTAMPDPQVQSVPMNAIIDLRWMHPGVAGGVENLTRSFLKQLSSLDRFNHYALLMPAEIQYDFDFRGHPNITTRVVDGVGSQWQRLKRQGSNWLRRRLSMDNWHSPEVELLRTARSYSAEVALSMPGYIHPDLRPLKNVSFVLDLQYEYYPEFFSARELEERKRVFGAAIRMADHLLAISDYTRQTVLERFAVDPTRITTVYPAADPIFHPRCGHIRDTPVVLAKYGLAAGQYLFFPANTWPHKNHRTALQALRLLKDNYHLDPLLVCAGNVKEAQPELLRLIRHLNLTDRVRFLGYCPLPDFPALYEGAAALVFPSYFEGFGIPLAEAMWCDCPIVSSNATCLPEIAGDAALFFEPHSPEQMADAAYRILTDSELRRRLTARGRQQVKKFSWQTFTTETIRVLRQVCDLRYGAGDSNSA